MIEVDINKLFTSSRARKIYTDALATVREHGMDRYLSGGVLVGFSGGADSVMLLCVLKKYAAENLCPKICAVHVNHMIRGAEADRDEVFSREVCNALGVEFFAVRHDVPTMAKELSLGLEEAARETRYSIFNQILQSRNDVSCIAVAHNATDNLETVIFNMLRGSGIRGVSGIPPVRDKIIRPLISSPKRDILAALSDAQIPFVTDSTNADTEYKRNYIRAEILPKLFSLIENPEAQVSRLSSNLRSDAAYIEGVAKSFLDGTSFTPTHNGLKELHYSVFSRVVAYMAKKGGASSIEHSHITKIHELIHAGGDFSVSLPGGVSFISHHGVCAVRVPQENIELSYEYKLSIGENYIPEIDAYIILSPKPIDDIYSKVYKISIQQSIDFDIIKGELYVRERRDGDSYTYGKMTRKLKKLFNDKSIPPENRQYIPVICDNCGILWVAGFGVRDGGAQNAQNKLYIAVAYRA